MMMMVMMVVMITTYPDMNANSVFIFFYFLCQKKINTITNVIDLN